MMKNGNTEELLFDAERLARVCGLKTEESDLPQISSEEDVAADICQALTCRPRKEAFAYLHHQLSDDGLDYEDFIL